MTTTDSRPPADLDRDWPLLTDEGERDYWRIQATRAATKIDAGLCINPRCAGALLGSGFTCGDDGCIDYVCDDLPASVF